MQRVDREGVEARFDEARARLDRERERTAEELAAFRAFETELRALGTESVSVEGDAGVTTTVVRSGRGNGGLDAVREAYESTIMAVPHYTDEYDDAFAESVSGEFGPDVATVLSGRRAFDGPCKRALLTAASAAQERREAFLDALDAERESLAAAREGCLPVAAELEAFESRRLETLSFGSLDAHRARLSVLADRCEELAADRQAALKRQRRSLWLPTDGPDVAAYVYQDLAATYPVLSTVADLADRIEGTVAAVERAMGYCN